MEGNHSYKQTNKSNLYGAPVDRSHTIRSIRQFRYLTDDQKLTHKILTYYCLKMQKSKRGITKCQREHDWVKLNKILHSGKFEEQVCLKLYESGTSGIISCCVETTILSAKEVFFFNLKFKGSESTETDKITENTVA